MTFKEYKGLDLVAAGNEILDRWRKMGAFEKSLEIREGAPEFIFFEGPPSANGMPGIHHVMARSINLLTPDGFAVPESNFVLVGMAGLMAGVMQAPMTAIFLIAEISGGYDLLVPLIMSSTIAFGTTRIFEKYSIYTKRIAQTGELITHDSDKAVLTLLKTAELVETDFSPVRIDATLGEFVEVISRSKRNTFPVVDSHGRYQGYVGFESVRRDMFKTELYDKLHVYNFMMSSPYYVYEDDSMESVMDKFERSGRGHLPVVDANRKYLGFISKPRMLSAYREELKVISQD